MLKDVQCKARVFPSWRHCGVGEARVAAQLSIAPSGEKHRGECEHDPHK